MTLIHTVHTLPILFFFLGGGMYLSILNTSVPRLTGVTKSQHVLSISPLCGCDVFDGRDIKTQLKSPETQHISPRDLVLLITQYNQFREIAIFSNPSGLSVIKCNVAQNHPQRVACACPILTVTEVSLFSSTETFTVAFTFHK